MCASLKPGAASLPPRSTVRVRSPINCLISAVEPTRTIRSPLIATASANDEGPSPSHTRPLVNTRSARAPAGESADPCEVTFEPEEIAERQKSVIARKDLGFVFMPSSDNFHRCFFAVDYRLFRGLVTSKDIRRAAGICNAAKLYEPGVH